MAFLEGSIDAQARDRGLKEMLGDGQRGHERLEAARERMAPAVDRLILRARAEGAIRPDVDSIDLAVVAGMLAQVSPAATPELWRRYVPLVLEGLRARPGHHEPLPLKSPTEVEVLKGRWRGPTATS